MVARNSIGLSLLAASLVPLGRMMMHEDRKSDQTYNDGLAEAARKEQPKLEKAEAKRKRKAERLKREAKNWR